MTTLNNSGAFEQLMEVPTCGIYVDAEGDWFYQGNKIIRLDILELFYEHLELDSDGKYIIQWKQNRCALTVEDTAFVVTRVDKVSAKGAGGEHILLTLKNLPVQEPLDPNFLHVGKDHVLYCKVRSGRFPARFSRPAYYQVAEWVEEEATTGRFHLVLGGSRFPIEVRCDA